MTSPGWSCRKRSHGEQTWFAGKDKVFAILDDHHHGAAHLSVWRPQPMGAQEVLIGSDPRARIPAALRWPERLGRRGAGHGSRLARRSRGSREAYLTVATARMGAGWAVGIVPLHTLCLTVGGITSKPGLVDGRIEPREYLALTASIDHDIVGGAPAARFARQLRELIEGAAVLHEVSR